MLDKIMSLFDGIYIPQFHVVDIIEIFIIIFCIYIFVKNLKNTRTFVLVKAIIIFAILYFLAQLLSFNVVKIIFQSLAWVALIAVIVIFQPELRRTLERIGTVGFKSISIKEMLNVLFNKTPKDNLRYSDETISELVDACFKLGKAKTGALIVIQGDVPLNEYVATGIPLNADISKALIINIFEKNTPLHDGAVIAVEDKLTAATCYLPLSDNPNISKKLGTRHRAAVGISELIDCCVIVVSEETGRVSFVNNGQIIHCAEPEILKNELKEFQKKSVKIKKKKWFLDNIGLKIFAVFAGFLVWFSIVVTNDPITTKIIENVPITIINEDAITDIDKAYSITSGNTVDIQVKDTRSRIEPMTKNDITVIADMSKLSYVFSVPLSAKARLSTTEVTFVSDSTISVDIEDVISKEFPLTFKIVGSPSPNIYISKITSSIDSIVITATESVIATIDSVQYSVDVTGARQNFSKEVKPVIYDKNGAVIDSNKYTLNRESVQVSAEVLNTKSIPLDITLIGDATKDYKMSIIDYSPTSIKIAGTDENLALIDRLDIEIKSEMNVSSAVQDTFEKEINLADYLPENIYIASGDGKASINISYEPFITKEITFSPSDIEVENLPENMSVTFKDVSFTATITGLKEQISNITIADLAPYIDLSGLEEGIYNIKLIFKNPESYKLQVPNNITIEIAKN